jgi:hypothetical protein
MSQKGKPWKSNLSHWIYPVDTLQRLNLDMYCLLWNWYCNLQLHTDVPTLNLKMDIILGFLVVTSVTKSRWWHPRETWMSNPEFPTGCLFAWQSLRSYDRGLVETVSKSVKHVYKEKTISLLTCSLQKTSTNIIYNYNDHFPEKKGGTGFPPSSPIAHVVQLGGAT